MQSSIATSLALAIQSLANSNPTSPVRVVNTPSPAKCLAFKDEVHCSNGTYVIAAKHFPELFAPLHQVTALQKKVATPLTAIKEGDNVLAYAVKDIKRDIIIPQLRRYLRRGGKQL